MTHNTKDLIPLDWDHSPLEYSWKDVVVKFKVTITTKSLSLNHISDYLKKHGWK
jgi:hypothetical protein